MCERGGPKWDEKRAREGKAAHAPRNFMELPQAARAAAAQRAATARAAGHNAAIKHAATAQEG